MRNDPPTSNHELPPPQACDPTTTVRVDGFRSLRQFKIDLRPGLNLLVGPNGSGKSNFIDFLDFLFTFLRNDAPLAVSRAGGLAKVFSQENLRKKSPALHISINGLASTPPNNAQGQKEGYFRYHYSISLCFNKRASALYVRDEQLKLGRVWDTIERALLEKHFYGAIQLSRPHLGIDVSPKWAISPRLLVGSARNPLTRTSRFNATRMTPAEHLQRYLGKLEVSDFEPDRSFLSQFTRSNFPALDAVRTAMTRGRSFNISPMQARQADDLSRQPFIDRDGSGLSATLHFLQSLRRGRPTQPYFPSDREVDQNTLVQIIDWTKLVYPQLSDIAIHADVALGNYICSLIIGRDKDNQLRIPFHSISDGTLKWLVLVTILLTSGTTYSIEEPENFLHPRMQQYLVAIIRDTLLDRGLDYFLLSTHSETIVNQCRAEEILIFDFVGGRTVANRIREPSKTQEEVNRTGFGLGYYYVNNALS